MTPVWVWRLPLFLLEITHSYENGVCLNKSRLCYGGNILGNAADWSVLLFLIHFFLQIDSLMIILERDRAWAGEGQRGRHRIRSRLQTLGCQHRAWHGAQTHEPWDHDLSRSRMPNRLSHRVSHWSVLLRLLPCIEGMTVCELDTTVHLPVFTLPVARTP